jgi:hypothetical protein
MLCAMRTWRAEEWPAVRARGKGAFLLRYGVLGRGLPLGALAAIAIEAALGHPFPETLWSTSFFARLLFCVAVLSASGCVEASFNWSMHEKHYAKRA